jgi:membrane glycosyltransferase
LARRRLVAIALNLATYVPLCAVMAWICAAGGWTWIDIAMFVCFLFVAPWSVLGFWNAALGLWLVYLRGDAMAIVAPYAAAGDQATRLQVRTAVVSTLRNEDPRRALARLAAIKRGLDATGEGRQFAYFVLSDTDRPDIAVAEAAAFAAWRESEGADAPLTYRRRAENIGFKAGNLRDFCVRHGRAYEFMLVLDADSFMSGETIVRLVRIGEAHPELGILQSLAVGLPAASAFGRLFQFGMRHGMRPYTMGSAWWAGDCGQFWGHNALVRIAPFVDHCDLPILPGKPPLGGRILSHDQVEGALMRRAGFEVRVLPQETGSYEDNPPDIVEFTRRDLRWCQGNMQYWRLLNMPGLEPTSRFQLLWAILMFLGLPAMTVLVALVALRPFGLVRATYPVGMALALYLVMLFLHVAPKLAGFLDIAMTRGGLRRYGGGLHFALGCLLELVVSFLTGAVTSLHTSRFMLGLPFGRVVGWGSQARDAHALSWQRAARLFWSHTVLGLVVLVPPMIVAPAVALWSLPFTAGYVLAIPFAVITASPRLGALMARWRLCGVPEEFATPPELLLLGQAQAAMGKRVARLPMHTPG